MNPFFFCFSFDSSLLQYVRWDVTDPHRIQFLCPCHCTDENPTCLLISYVHSAPDSQQLVLHVA